MEQAMPRLAASVPSPRPARRATNVTLPEALLHQARGLGINLSRACERGIRAEIAALGAERWLAENRAAIAAWNAHIPPPNGLPLGRFRDF